MAFLLTAASIGALAGCGGDSDDDSATPDAGASPAGQTTPTPAVATTTTPAPARAGDGDSPFVVVTSLLGKPLPSEPGCRFAKHFVPDRASPATYDGSLTLTVTCPRADGYVPVGQIVNRRGSKPTDVTCRDTQNGELYCIFVPSANVGLYFTGTDRKVVRRRLERLIEVVRALPSGRTPLSGATSG